MFNSCIF